jgi:rod shape-determining protein MreC
MFPAFLAQNRRYVVLILYLLVSLFLMIVTSSSAVRAFRTTVFGAFGTLTAVFTDARQWSSDFWDSVRKMRDLRRELQVAYERIYLLQDAGIAIGSLKAENEQLKELLGYQKKLPWKTIPAEIIAKDPRYYYNTVVVNKGRNDGVAAHMPVIAWQDGQSGIVGKVIEAGMRASKILLLTDPNSYISAMIKSSGYAGLVRGGGSRNQHLEFLYVDRNAGAAFGDLVVTSGQGGLFPRGLSIGVVMSVEDARYGLYYREIKVLPVIDFNKLESVFIVDQPFSEEIGRMRESGDDSE